jgi:hypothetical protein
MTMNPVLHSFAYSLDYLREQVDDIDDATMFVQPDGIVNHPAWVIGHITAAIHLLASTIGVPKWLPKDFINRYRTGTVPVGDTGVYENKNDLLALLHEVQTRISERIKQMNDAELDVPFPAESYRDVFPTMRHALTQVLIGHTAYHVGQVGVWRKAMGMPPMKRSFE